MVGEIYTEIILDLYKNPINKGNITKPEIDVSGGNPSCGDQVEFTMRIKNDIIEDIKFKGSGCAISVASSSIITEMVKGKNVQQAKKISKEAFFDELGNIIQTRIKCALLGFIVLKKGIEAYEKNNSKPTLIKGIVI
ncbi:MAG: SUF system NifU family Fe-S cluster assembly protein [archaeon]|nr:SUF system NifU family Fe-S cluster assembly protein [archaeon]